MVKNVFFLLIVIFFTTLSLGIEYFVFVHGQVIEPDQIPAEVPSEEPESPELQPPPELPPEEVPPELPPEEVPPEFPPEEPESQGVGGGDGTTSGGGGGDGTTSGGGGDGTTSGGGGDGTTSGGGGGDGTGGGDCLIATAAFGSELSPQVQFLRNFRDVSILSTSSGSSFMSAFNAWYYSFSPYIAEYERQQPWFQQSVRITLYPLLGSLYLSEKAYSLTDGEYGALGAGLIASCFIGMIYFSPLALLFKQVRRGNFNLKIVISIALLSCIAVLISVITDNQVALMITTPLFVVTIISVSSILSARLLMKFKQIILDMISSGLK